MDIKMTTRGRYRPFISPSTAIKAIIYTNIFMFIASLIFSGRNIAFSLNPFYALTPSIEVLSFLGASGKIPIMKFQAWWSLITANWLHGGLLHIVFNMIALRTVAALTIKEYGIYRMFSIYTLAGAFGFLLSYLGNVYITIGASSGLCGLIGAALYFGRSRGGHWGQLVYKQTSGWVLSLAVIGFLMPNINNWSHAGGVIGGIFLGWLFGYEDKRKENFLDRILGAALAGLTFILLLKSVLYGAFLIYG